MDELAEHRKILVLAAANQLPKQIDDNSGFSLLVLRELVNSGMLTARVFRTLADGTTYLDPRITLAGREYLDNLRKREGANLKGAKGGSWWRRGGIAVVGIIAFAASLVAVLDYFGIGPFDMLGPAPGPTMTLLEAKPVIPEEGNVFLHTRVYEVKADSPPGNFAVAVTGPSVVNLSVTSSAPILATNAGTTNDGRPVVVVHNPFGRYQILVRTMSAAPDFRLDFVFNISI